MGYLALVHTAVSIVAVEDFSKGVSKGSLVVNRVWQSVPGVSWMGCLLSAFLHLWWRETLYYRGIG